ncbi:cysteine-rich venom protein Cau1-like [Eublepharis macularius]|uniref:Cysteine-rich venom protein Cau1-like n=1 Tax=Eublepharis macularius TaxID=481883 RepID=A0AA97IW01_EUBMA|nr:cysteine-rich venom protein Cau1-like [Eublepharis macularius]
MILLTIVLLLAAVLDQSLEQEENEENEEEDESDLLTGSGISPEIQQQILDKHNDLRREVEPTARNMLKMTIYRSNFVSSWPEVVDYWNTKKDNFQYGVGRIDPSKSIYSYTQAIWYNSYMLGCGISYCPDSQYPFMYICQYCPAGNIAGRIGTPYNEGPPCGDCPKYCEDKLCTNPCKYVDLINDCDKLKALMGCSKANKHGLCNATCKCKNKII